MTSLRLPLVVIEASGMPCASTIRWCLLPALPRSTGDGPVAGSPFIARMRLESTAARQEVQQVCGPQLGQQQLVQALPDSGRVPVPQPSPAGHPRAEAQLLGQKLPADPGVQHEQDPAQRLATIQSLTTWTQRITVRPRTYCGALGWALIYSHSR